MEQGKAVGLGGGGGGGGGGRVDADGRNSVVGVLEYFGVGNRCIPGELSRRRSWISFLSDSPHHVIGDGGVEFHAT